MPKLLIIDDDKHLLDALKTRFRAGGFDVVEATNGYDGTLLMQSNRFDGVITDLMMPGGGFMVLRHLKRLNQSPPVIVITGFYDASMLRKARELGAQQVLKKPLSFMEIFKAVHCMLNSDEDTVRRDS